MPTEETTTEPAAPLVPSGADPRLAPSKWTHGWRAFLLRPELGLPLITLLLAVYLSFASEYFLQRQNLLNITEAVAVIGIAAAFATLVVIGGGIDLTPVTVMIVTGIVVLRALQHGMPVVPAVALALLAGAAIGLLNGLLIAIGNLNPFIVTLGTNFLFTGIAYVATEGNSQIIENSTFLEIGQSRLFWNIPTSSVIMLASFAAAFFLLRLTRFGTHIFAVGGGEAAARLSGVRVLSVKIWLYVLSALSAAVAGIVLSSASGSVAPYAASNSNDLLSILAAVIIGGTALTGGRGSVVGTAVGVLLLGLIANGLVLENISSFYQPVVTGAILLIAIVLDEVQAKGAAADMSDTPLIEARGLTKRYGSIVAVDGIDLTVGRAEIVAVVGDNGAGKSTLIKMLSGAIHPDAGEIVVDGEPRRFRGPNDSRALGIEALYQDLALLPNLDVATNLYLGREPTIGGVWRPLGLLARRRMRRDAAAHLEELRIQIPRLWGTPVESLSGGQRQSVAIARALVWASSLVIMDEPTAALGVAQSQAVLELAKRVREKGTSVLIISHILPHVLDLADRVVVLRHGRKVADLPGPELTQDRLIELIIGYERERRS